MRKGWQIAALVAVSALSAGAASAESCKLSDADERAIRAVAADYVKHWKASDAEGVIGLLHEDVVLLPGRGMEPISGKEAARNWWFPEDRAPIPLSLYESQVADVTGCGDMAVLHGRSEIAWEQDGKAVAQEGNFLTVLTRGADGEWRISRRIWNNRPLER